MEFFAQDQRDKCNCGVLVLIALFRTVSLVSSDTSTNIIISRWFCAVTNGAYKKYRKEILHLLIDVIDVVDNEPISQRDARAGVAEPKPRSRKKCADLFYFTKVLTPKLQTVSQTYY